MAKVYLGLGSNIGDKKDYLERAIKLLTEHERIQMIKSSSYYETEPIGYTEQDLFLNIVIEIDTLLEPYDLLAYCNKIEEKLNRQRVVRWGPRTIDIDILLYDQHTSDEEQLMLPHPRMCERAFVMIPLYEIAKDIHINGVHIENLMQHLDTKGIKRIAY